jgi:integrase
MMTMGSVVVLREEIAPKRQMPLRKPNAELRTREYLSEREMEKLIEAAKSNRHGHRDSTMILICYRHGLRASEVCDLRWDQVHFTSANLHVRRRKNGAPSTHPLGGSELRALRRLKRDQEPPSPYLFVSERGAPFSTEGFARLLRARHERPSSRAAEKRHELATSDHSITSSARSRIDAGSVMPISFAVFKFATSWNRVGRSAGNSATFAPCRTLRAIAPT